ncbi:MAG: tetratricopeptide repeat protein [Chloroflexi bacterium]|nr:tetratricopeptide repeat protein [Chloroflexota bacterium]MCI0646193.1 tetratricopeptide repeat protein [Chloroflexota bacterium]
MSTTRHLDHLENAGLIRLAARPEVEYLFRHALVWEAAYTSLLKTDRQQLHLAIAQLLETLAAGQALDGEQAALLAYHFEQAGSDDQAIYYLELAGDLARSVYANQEAIDFYNRGLLLAGQAAAGRCQQAAQLAEKIGDVLGVTGQPGAAGEQYRQALATVPSSDPLWQARLQRKSGDIARDCYQHKLALDAYNTAEATLEETSPRDAAWWQEWLQVQVGRMLVYYWQNQWPAIAGLAERTRPLVERYATPALRARFYDALAGMLTKRDRYVFSEEILDIIQAGLAAAEESGDLRETTNARFNLGFGHLWRNELAEAEKQLQTALDIAERTGDALYETWCLTYLAVIYRKRGQVEDVRKYVECCLVVATSPQTRPWLSFAWSNLAWAAWREGNLAAAERHGQTALEISNSFPTPNPFEGLIRWPLVGAALQQGQARQAIEHVCALLEPNQQPMPQKLEAVVQAAVQSWEAGRLEAAQTSLQQALAMAWEQGLL